jgi:hypothetical protein
MQGFGLKDDPAKMGFDIAIDFQPDFYAPVPRQQAPLTRRLITRFTGKLSLFSDHEVRKYDDYVQYIKQVPFPEYKWLPSITPMWDNSARRQSGAYILRDENPAAYEDWLKHIVTNFQPPSREDNFVFINAWNEWAEGNHLEPCLKWGRAYLEATKRVVNV